MPVIFLKVALWGTTPIAFLPIIVRKREPGSPLCHCELAWQSHRVKLIEKRGLAPFIVTFVSLRAQRGNLIEKN